MNFYLRAKGGLAHGWGHVIRSQTLATHLTCETDDVTWCVEGDAAVAEYVQKAPLAHRFIPDEVGQQIEEEILTDIRPDVIVVDMIEVPSDVLQLYRRYCRTLVVFNDMGITYSIGDIIVCPQILTQYPEVNDQQILLRGPDYFILREDICQLQIEAKERQINQVPRQLLVIMGGCVNRPVFEKVVDVLESIEDLDLDVNFVVGYDLDVDLDDYQYLKKKGVSFLPGSGDIGQLMAASDLALAASGYVKYELAALGVPTVLVSVVDHQEILGEVFASQSQCADYCGDIVQKPPRIFADALRDLVDNREKRQSYASMGMKLVDGQALTRITEKILWKSQN